MAAIHVLSTIIRK